MNVAGLGAITTQPIFQAPATHGAAAGDAPKTDFGAAIRSAVDRVDQAQGESAASVQQLLTGRQEDILPTVAAVAKADISFKLLIGIRNKMIEAYKQTMTMQV